MILINYKVQNRDFAVGKLDRYINQVIKVNKHHQERDREMPCASTRRIQYYTCGIAKSTKSDSNREQTSHPTNPN